MVKTLLVNEIFCSIQGESTHAGRRCAFVRLAGCNLSCSWCDTRYALDEAGRELSLDMIIEAVRPYEVDLVEITGGEPLIQSTTPDLAMRLAHEGYEVLVETNGSRDISLLPHPIKRIMDLKGPSSGEMDRNRFENLLYLRHGDEVKFVIADSNDYEWAKVTIGGGDYPAATVDTLFSPVQGRLEARQLAEWIILDRLPVRLNLQVHKYIWPDVERGV
jgi:Organic radical activating enzymes